MEMGGAEPGHVPKSYSLNMSKDFIPMCIFSETSHGECSVWRSCLLKEITFLSVIGRTLIDVSSHGFFR